MKNVFERQYPQPIIHGKIFEGKQFPIGANLTHS